MTKRGSGSPSAARTSALRATADKARRPTAKKRAPRYTAKTADRYELYQLSVQAPEDDVAFLRRAYRRANGREPLHFREDFCGTALLCATWAALSPQHTAEGYDLDPEPLAWGRARNLAPLGEAASRIELRLADARSPGRRASDVRVAQNFSYCIFKERRVLLDYFRGAREGLAEGGIFAIDLYGGTEATDVVQEPRRIEGGFTYVWDQARYLPGTGDYWCKIHFRFRDGSELRDAFTYQWRFWGLPELRDLLREAGFREVQTYFEQTDDEDGAGNGVFKRDDAGRTAEGCAGWIAYLVALK